MSDDIPEEMKKNVIHPSHYTFGKYEVMDVIEDWDLNYHLGCAVKYIARAGKKNPDKYEEDLQKAIWYIQRHIKSRKKGVKISNENG